jgi:copper(I)-binding protein
MARLPVRQTTRLLLAALIAAGSCTLAMAQAVTVSNAWARATVPGQKGAGVFMTLTSAANTRLVSASSPVAAFGQVHEMRMEADIMKMHALKDGLELPAGKAVELKPGSFHIMLMDLKAPLQKDSTIAVTLEFVDSQGVHSNSAITVPVQAMGQMAHTGHAEPAQK